jgi:hypothetical protein
MSRESLLKLCGFGLTAACFAATSVYSYSFASATIPVVGAAVTNHANCKNCSDNGTKTRRECYDLDGPPCDAEFCTVNDYQFAQCEVGMPGGEDDPCDTEPDPNDWYRRATVKDPSSPCTSPGRNIETWPACGIVISEFDSGTWNSPCFTATCDGPTQFQLTYPSRSVCD